MFCTPYPAPWGWGFIEMKWTTNSTKCLPCDRCFGRSLRLFAKQMMLKKVLASALFLKNSRSYDALALNTRKKVKTYGIPATRPKKKKEKVELVIPRQETSWETASYRQIRLITQSYVDLSVKVKESTILTSGCEFVKYGGGC